MSVIASILNDVIQCSCVDWFKLTCYKNIKNMYMNHLITMRNLKSTYAILLHGKSMAMIKPTTRQ